MNGTCRLIWAKTECYEGKHKMYKTFTQFMPILSQISKYALRQQNIFGRCKEVSLKVNSENTKRVFMYVMSIALYTLFTEQVLYILYTCSIAYIQSIQKYQTTSSVASPVFMVRDTCREFHLWFAAAAGATCDTSLQFCPLETASDQ